MNSSDLMPLFSDVIMTEFRAELRNDITSNSAVELPKLGKHHDTRVPHKHLKCDDELPNCSSI